MSSTANMMRRMPSVFAGALSGSALTAGGVWNFVSSTRLWPSGVRIMAMSARTSLSPTTRSTQRPSTVDLPSSSIPSSAKNALAASRSSTTMRTLSIRNNLLFAVIFLLRFGRPEHVPLPVDRVDQADGVAVVHLLTELPDADGDRVRITLVVVPDPLLDILAREHPSLVAGERLQKSILPRRERDLPAGATHASRLGVDLQIIDPDEPRPVDRRAADERPHPNPQLRHLERLGQVVVRADLEPADSVLQGAASGQHQDRRRIAAPPERLAHLPAVDAGEHQVQDDGGILPLSGQRQRLDAVARPIDSVARLLQTLPDPAGDRRFIFDE